LKYDLHLHSTASDGRLNPEQVVDMAVSKGLELIALTDHDSVSGIDRALARAAEYPDIRVIPGVEINTDLASGELHVLGYFMNYKDSEFVTALEKIRESRVGRAQKMVSKLNKLGLSVEWQRVQDLAKGESICRPHIAQVMLEKGYVSTEREAFDNYIGRNGPAYVEREKVLPVEAVRIIKKAGGLPVLAHPADIQDLDKLLLELISAGLVGLETYYGSYDSKTIKRIALVAEHYKLFTTGGTDYHHFGDGVEVPMGSVNVPRDSIDNLFEAAGLTYKAA
jgi:predicted metal-dependent phosphoesterase TrpH